MCLLVGKQMKVLLIIKSQCGSIFYLQQNKEIIQATLIVYKLSM